MDNREELITTLFSSPVPRQAPANFTMVKCKCGQNPTGYWHGNPVCCKCYEALQKKHKSCLYNEARIRREHR